MEVDPFAGVHFLTELGEAQGSVLHLSSSRQPAPYAAPTRR